ncbi:tumor necrosis factor receptor superfamily member 9 isoform X3 [Rhinatrema bivittatum]|uniref:tumor necrosis factor receptor superfamily member 9 isoform X3 n=1 Tax=Rhinatrema bivittatum TaxID=194408 RepID=UPI001126CC25|nr:tumor necrosis factor receptor superfamily member 9 isoform X3 [Rhinatrema bivittatum]
MEPASSAILHVLLLVLNLRNLLGAVLPCEGERQSCPPGTFYNVRNCSGCIKCPAGSYSSQSDRLSYCHKCRICTGIFKYKTSCSSTQNAQCQCPAGFRCIGENCNRCARNCEAGQEQTGDYCTACSSGTFTDQINGFCRPWTNCTDQGLVLLANGTSKTDAVCGSSPTVKATVSSAASTSNPVGSVPYNPERSITVHVILTVISVLFLLCLVVVTMHVMRAWGRKKVKNGFRPVPNIQLVQTAEQEDACSCRFPEEEEGETVPSTYQPAISA